MPLPNVFFFLDGENRFDITFNPCGIVERYDSL
jgi:hypothetical protein